jgi:hypothetical protein
MNSPARIVWLHANVRIVSSRLRRGQEDEVGVQTAGLVGSPDQFPPDATSLKGIIHRQVRQLRAVGEVGDRARDPDEVPIDSRCQDNVGVVQHAADHLRPIDWPAFRQCRSNQQIDEFFRAERGFELVVNNHVGPLETSGDTG